MYNKYSCIIFEVHCDIFVSQFLLKKRSIFRHCLRYTSKGSFVTASWSSDPRKPEHGCTTEIHFNVQVVSHILAASNDDAVVSL